MKVIRIDHVAMIVDDLAAMLGLLRTFGLPLESTEEVPQFGAMSSMVSAGNANIELLSASDPSGGCARQLEKRGAGLHHVCLEVESLETAIAELNEHGLKLVDGEPWVDSAGRRVWLHPQSGQGVLFGIFERHPAGK